MGNNLNIHHNKTDEIVSHSYVEYTAIVNSTGADLHAQLGINLLAISLTEISKMQNRVDHIQAFE
jgi:hypothetical protein